MNKTVSWLRTTEAIRQRCNLIYEAGVRGELEYFRLNLDKLPACAKYVCSVIRDEYPTLAIPYHSRWRHFDVGNRSRAQQMFKTKMFGPLEELRAKFDLVITSVLLDAGAGPAWKYREPGTKEEYSRSEGLAVASFHMFCAGAFSAKESQPLRADADALLAITDDIVAKNFQAGTRPGDDNFLVGLSGRTLLLKQLGTAIKSNPEVFTDGRLGSLADYLLKQTVSAGTKKTLPATSVLGAVLVYLGSIWPGRITMDGVNLGDVWVHPKLNDLKDAPGLVPFHKLSQWLTYSLLEPLEEHGIEITHIDALTGLPEYRNGGLFLDSGVLATRDPSLSKTALKPDHVAIVEWRALTVCLLDQIALLIQRELGLSRDTFPLAKVLQGGTWTAGRRIAAERRTGGGPPLTIESDGTVF